MAMLSCIRSVHSSNLDYEFSLIHHLINRLPFAAMHTEFSCPLPFSQSFQTPPSLYDTVKTYFEYSHTLFYMGLTLADVQTPPSLYDTVKTYFEYSHTLFYMGLTLADSHGHAYTWEFNFRDGNHIQPSRFAEKITSSGLVMSDFVTWVTCHSAYDLGYLIKTLTGRQLPNTLPEFLDLVKVYFGDNVFDLKYMMKFFYGGVDEMARLARVAVGNKSLLMSQAFQRFRRDYLRMGEEEKFVGVLHGVMEQFLSFQEKELLLEGRLSELPDDIVAYILSLLTMKEAGRTSVLSKRWRYTWAYIPVLDFDASDTLYKFMGKSPMEVRSLEEARYLRWVNEVVRLYKGSTIDEFRVRFDVSMKTVSLISNDKINNWFNFAMEKRVKKLELNFYPCVRGICNRTGYIFLYALTMPNLLASLELVYVDVSGEVLGKFLQSCPRLEYLSVKRSKLPVNLEISGEKLNLKYLEICSCDLIKYIEISAPNLVLFKYSGPEISLSLKSTPKLATLSIGGLYGQYVTNNFLEFRSCLLQLKELSLELLVGIKNGMKSVDQFPICARLEQLEVTVNSLNTENLYCFAALIKACPFLHKFVLKIVGFEGKAIDKEFIPYLINLHMPIFEGSLTEFERKSKKRARKHAKLLRVKLKPRIEVIII